MLQQDSTNDNTRLKILFFIETIERQKRHVASKCRKGFRFRGRKTDTLRLARCIFEWNRRGINLDQLVKSISLFNTYSRIDKQRPFPLSKKNDVSSPFILPPFLFRMHSIPETRIEVDAPHDIGD